MLERSATRYRLAPHVFGCYRAGALYLLDIKADRYYGLPDPAPALLQDIRPEAPWCVVDRLPCERAIPEELDQHTLDQLLAQKLLLQDDVATPARPKTSIDRPTSALFESYAPVDAEVRTRDVCELLLVSLSVALRFRFCSMEAIINRLFRVSETRRSAFDLERAEQCLARVNRLQPILYSAADECLFDSIVRFEMLARIGLIPTFVIGVVAKPFAAHCWLQYGSVVLNDAAERVREYTPLLVI